MRHTPHETPLWFAATLVIAERGCHDVAEHEAVHALLGRKFMDQHKSDGACVDVHDAANVLALVFDQVVIDHIIFAGRVALVSREK